MAKQDDIRLAHLTAPDAPATVTVEQAARILGVSRGAAYRAVRAGEIPAIRVGRRIIVPVRALDELLRARPGA